MILSLDIPASVPAKTDDIPGSVTITNNGLVAVEGVEVVVETVQGGGFHFYFTLEEALDPGNAATFNFTWYSRNKKSYTWKATVTPADNDSDTDNNILTKEVIVFRPALPPLEPNKISLSSKERSVLSLLARY